MLTPQQFYDTYKGQSLLYNTADPSLTGHCVQAVCFYVVANNAPVMWRDAYYWKGAATAHPSKYQWVDNSATAVPPPGALVIWLHTLPNSGGAGHIAVCLRPLPGTGTFISVDSNWGGKTVKLVTHNYDYVAGWLIIKSAPVAPVTQGDEMITTRDQAIILYEMLRPNGGPSEAEIVGSVNRRSFAQFMWDARPEIAARNQALSGQANQLNNLNQAINSSNQTITELTIKLNDAAVSNADKQKALDDALASLANNNAELTTAHDKMADMQRALATAKVIAPAATKAPWFVRLLTVLVKP